MKVYFATNRKLERSASSVGFGNGVQPLPGAFMVGAVEVDHSAGAWVADTARMSLAPELVEESVQDGRPVRRVIRHGSESLFASMRDTALDPATGDILILLHGAGHTMTSSLETAARCAELYSDPQAPLPRDLTVGSVTPQQWMIPFALCYPTNGRGNPIDYFLDRDDALRSGLAIARTFGRLVQFVSRLRRQDRCDTRIHLLAHSLGNFALRNAVQSIVQRPDLKPARLFDTVLLLHADEDSDSLFDPEKLGPLPLFTKRIAIYFDRSDKLTRLSDAVHMDRLGQKGPQRGQEISGLACEVSAIDCSAATFDLVPDSQRHRHYFGARSVVQDIRQVLAGQDPHRVAGREADASRPGFYRIIEPEGAVAPPQ